MFLYNNSVDDEPTAERVESHGGGMDNFTPPTQLPPNAYQYGENTVLIDNLRVRTRPGADRLGANFGNYNMQGLLYFDIPGTERLITAANGSFYYWDGANWSAAIAAYTISTSARFSAAQGVGKALFTGGTASTMAVYDGTAFAVFDQNLNIHPATASIVVWCAGRMWAAGFPGTATNPDGTLDQSLSDDSIWGSSLLAFGQGDWDRTGRSFRIGKGEGSAIIGLAVLPASVPGQEVLCVLKGNGVHVLRVDPNLNPANYQNSYNPETIANGLGVVGKRAYAVWGNDLYWVAPDKSFRNLSRMQAAAGQYAVSLPISIPMQPFIDRINWSKASLITVVAYRQLVLFSVPLDASSVPNYVLAWNGRLQKWVGVWTGWTPLCFEVTRFSDVNQLVIGDSVGNVRQWKDTSATTDDNTYLDDGVSYATEYDSRSFIWAEPLNPKSPLHFEARFAASNALVDFTLVGDQATLATWEKDLRPVDPSLPIDLPFDLTNPDNTPATKGLVGTPSFTEAYVKIRSESGWFELRNISMSAWLDTMVTSG